MKANRFVISLGGSVVVPKGGIDPVFLRETVSFFRKQAGKGRRFVVVVGGGATCRKYMEAAAAVTRVPDRQMDWIGIRTTILNATLVQSVLGDMAHGKIVTDPRVRLKSAAPIIVAAGWKPGFSSDMDAVILAESFGTRTVVNLSNVSHVYDSDPRINPRARKIEKMTWPEFSRAFGTKWVPGLNAPFDPVAAVRARRAGIGVVIADGTDLRNLALILDGRKFHGTTLG